MQGHGHRVRLVPDDVTNIPVSASDPPTKANGLPTRQACLSQGDRSPMRNVVETGRAEIECPHRHGLASWNLHRWWRQLHRRDDRNPIAPVQPNRLYTGQIGSLAG